MGVWWWLAPFVEDSIPLGFPGGSVVKTLPANAGDTGTRPGKIPWRRKWQPFQYSCLGNPLNRGAWWLHKELDMTLCVELDTTLWSPVESQRVGHNWARTFISPMIVLGLLSKIILINLCLFLCQYLIVLVVIAFILFFFWPHSMQGFSSPTGFPC